MTTWHITWGTYATRLHGAVRPTVSKAHHARGEALIEPDPELEEAMRFRTRFDPVYFTREQCLFIQDLTPSLAAQGRWELRTCAAKHDHVHVILDIRREVHGEKARRLLKRWIGRSLNEKWPRVKGASWWAEEGSNIAIDNESYLNNAFNYVFDQRTK